MELDIVGGGSPSSASDAASAGTGLGAMLGGPVGALLGNLAGSVIGGLFSSKQASDNRSFQERMSSTAHQREVSDLRAAGLNPILSATGGSGSSTPSGAMASLPDMSHMGSSAFQAEQTKKMNQAQIRSMDFNIENTESDTFKKQAEKELTDQLKEKAKAETNTAKSTARIAESEAKGADVLSGLYKDGEPGDILKLWNIIRNSIGPAAHYR